APVTPVLLLALKAVEEGKAGVRVPAALPQHVAAELAVAVRAVVQIARSGLALAPPGHRRRLHGGGAVPTPVSTLIVAARARQRRERERREGQDQDAVSTVEEMDVHVSSLVERRAPRVTQRPFATPGPGPNREDRGAPGRRRRNGLRD